MRNTLLFLTLLFFACSGQKRVAGGEKQDPLQTILENNKTQLGKPASDPASYQVQIIYTQIDRDKAQKPHFTSYYFNVDTTLYFYPASTVKMPLSLLAMESMRQLQKTHPGLRMDTPYRMDSVQAKQMVLKEDELSANGLASLEHDIKKIFVVSDNYSYNNLFDFLGKEYINKTLQQKGYTRTGVMHRFSIAGIDNRYTRPVTFYEGNNILYRQESMFDSTKYTNPQSNLYQGKGYWNSEDSLINAPFNFSGRNWTSLQDLHDILKAVLFPMEVPEYQRFDLTADDYRFLYKWMSIFPRECDYPHYEDTSEYFDGYCKLLLYGNDKAQRPEHLRIFNKEGDAYGYLTDVAYIVDFQNKVEFMLVANILCNEDGVFNDGIYNYDDIGKPFMANLGKAVYEYELKRKRKVKPDLSRFKINY